MSSPIRLTQTVTKGGCAAKLAAGTLSGLLATLPRQTHLDLVVGNDLLDDAAVWRLSSGELLVQTLDFFTPILDDPHDFGAVAAANALSDVYAMGAAPITALTVLAYPLETLGEEVLAALMAGASAKINEAGALLVGGHSIEDDTLKLGFSVAGLVQENALWSNQGAREGDVLILSKPLGTGTLMGALKNGELKAGDLSEAVASMKALNRLELPDELHREVHAATDVTGFGLLGHALHLAQGSRRSLRLEAGAVPLLEHAATTLRRGIVTRAHGSNERYVNSETEGLQGLDDSLKLALLDPQTSGGLLLSVAADAATTVLAHVRSRFPRAAAVGEVVRRGDYALLVV